MPAHLVLRFSDFGFDTIVEHRQIIAACGHVYWGWWKKDGVDRDLEADLSTLPTPILAGAFSRARPDFYSFRIVEVHCNPDGLPLASPDPSRTPTYYRENSCSAWFRIEEMRPLPRSAFESSFGPFPIGERTLFIRSNAETDDQRRRHPIVESEHDTILHLSDLHFGDDHGYPEQSGMGECSLVDRIAEDLQRLNATIGLVIISGDVLTRCDANSFPEVEDFVEELGRALHLDSRTQFLVVPGNHDIPLSERPDELVRDAVTYKHERMFRRFLTKIHGAEYEIPQFCQARLGGRPIDILLMNSIRLRHKPERDYGYVDWPIYETILRESEVVQEGTLRIAVLHHHLISALPVERPTADRPVSITLDAGDIIAGLQRHGFRLVLHGHQHVPGVARISKGLRKDDGRLEGMDAPIYVIGGGSAGAKRLYDPMPLNTYSLIRPSDDALHLQIRQYNKGREPDRYLEGALPFHA